MTFVFNASPLIVLAKSGLLETVLELPEKVTPALDAIVAAGLYISERHLEEVRKKAGE